MRARTEPAADVASAADAEDVWTGFARYFEESTEALVRDRGS